MILQTSISVLNDDFLHIENHKGPRKNHNEKKPEFRVQPEMILTLVQAGKVQLTLAGKTLIFQKGEIFLIGTNVPYMLEPIPCDPESAMYKSTVMYFNPAHFYRVFQCQEEYQDINSLLGVARRGIAISGNTKKLVIEKLLEMKWQVGYPRIESLLRTLHLISISKEIDYISDESVSVCEEEYSKDKLVSVLELINERYTENLSLHLASSKVGINKHYLCRLFKSRLQTTFNRYLNYKRMQAAVKCLEQTDKSIEEIANACGFKYSARFCVAFKKFSGYSPAQYRANHIKKIMWSTTDYLKTA